MTSVADLVVTHIDTYWDPAITPKPKILKVISAPTEKQIGESILVELISQTWRPINPEYADELSRLMVRIYTNNSDDRLATFANEVNRIFGAYVVAGYDSSQITATDDVSERQRNSYMQIKTAELLRFSVYRGAAVVGVPPSRDDLRDATFVTIADETTRTPYSVRHIDITEAEKHTPKQHELGGDRHLQTQPLIFSQSLTVQNNVTIQGNLDIQGTTTTVESTTLAVADNTIVVNKNETGAGVTLGVAGLEVERGSLVNTQILWDETVGRFILRDTTTAKKSLALRTLHLEDLDATPVGNIALKVLDQVLWVLDPTETAYKDLAARYVTVQELKFIELPTVHIYGPNVGATKDKDLFIQAGLYQNDGPNILMYGCQVGGSQGGELDLMYGGTGSPPGPFKIIRNNAGSFEDALVIDSSKNMDIVSGSLKIGGTEVISSGRIADFTSLKIGGTEVISSGRAGTLSNITVGTTKIRSAYPTENDICMRAAQYAFIFGDVTQYFGANTYWDGSNWRCVNTSYYPILFGEERATSKLSIYFGSKADPTVWTNRFYFNYDGTAYADESWLTFSAKIPAAIRDAVTELMSEVDRPNAPRDTKTGHLICDICGRDLSLKDNSCEHRAAFEERFTHNPDKVSRLTAKVLWHLVQKLLAKGVIKNEDLT